MEFVETTAFQRDLPDYLSDDEYRALQAHLELHPEAGDVIRNTGGLRKIRWAQEARGKGTRGGVRVIYFLFTQDHQVFLMAIFDKDTKDDLSSDDRKALRTYIKTEIERRRDAR